MLSALSRVSSLVQPPQHVQTQSVVTPTNNPSNPAIFSPITASSAGLPQSMQLPPGNSPKLTGTGVQVGGPTLMTLPGSNAAPQKPAGGVASSSADQAGLPSPAEADRQFKQLGLGLGASLSSVICFFILCSAMYYSEYTSSRQVSAV